MQFCWFITGNAARKRTQVFDSDYNRLARAGLIMRNYLESYNQEKERICLRYNITSLGLIATYVASWVKLVLLLEATSREKKKKVAGFLLSGQFFPGFSRF